MVSPHFFHIEGVAAAVAIFLFTWGVIKGGIHIVDFFRNTTKLVRHMYVNELPHMERALRRICVKMGIDYDDPPIPPLEL